ncbi:MAG: DeoR/GlpR family DNA-binding transcription regulator, partial [Alkalispirochaeta sp.]
MRGSRLHAIQDFVFNKRHATLKELADRFGVSMNTVRRDVDVLLKWRAVEKVYGGVVANPHYRSYLHFGERSSTSTDEKSRIGRAAARLINRDDLLMMDAGSTVAGFAESIDQSIPLTVITNNMAVV